MGTETHIYFSMPVSPLRMRDEFCGGDMHGEGTVALPMER